MFIKKFFLASLLVSLSCFSNAALMLDTAIIAYDGLGYFGFEYTGDNLFHEDGYDFNGSEVFEADFGASWGYIDFNLTTVAMNIQDLAIGVLYIRVGGRPPYGGELETFGASGTINGSDCRFGAYDAGCTDLNGNVTEYESQFFWTYREVFAPTPVGVSEPSAVSLLVAGLFALVLYRRRNSSDYLLGS